MADKSWHQAQATQSAHQSEASYPWEMVISFDDLYEAAKKCANRAGYDDCLVPNYDNFYNQYLSSKTNIGRMVEYLAKVPGGTIGRAPQIFFFNDIPYSSMPKKSYNRKYKNMILDQQAQNYADQINYFIGQRSQPLSEAEVDQCFDQITHLIYDQDDSFSALLIPGAFIMREYLLNHIPTSGDLEKKSFYKKSQDTKLRMNWEGASLIVITESTILINKPSIEFNEKTRRNEEKRRDTETGKIKIQMRFNLNRESDALKFTFDHKASFANFETCDLRAVKLLLTKCKAFTTYRLTIPDNRIGQINLPIFKATTPIKFYEKPASPPISFVDQVVILRENGSVFKIIPYENNEPKYDGESISDIRSLVDVCPSNDAISPANGNSSSPNVKANHALVYYYARCAHLISQDDVDYIAARALQQNKFYPSVQRAYEIQKAILKYSNLRIDEMAADQYRALLASCDLQSTLKTMRQNMTNSASSSSSSSCVYAHGFMRR